MGIAYNPASRFFQTPDFYKYTFHQTLAHDISYNLLLSVSIHFLLMDSKISLPIPSSTGLKWA